jgi:hypothetical protein
VAFGAIGSLIVALTGGLMGLIKLPFWEICLAVLGIMLIISAPGMVIAWLKLRQRNMAPILDANGWAINGRVKMNVPFGGSLTSVATLPPGSLPGAPDPYGEKRSPWPGFVKFVVIVCFLFSLANEFELIGRGLKAAGVNEGDFPTFINKPGAAAKLAKAKEDAAIKAEADKAAEKK